MGEGWDWDWDEMDVPWSGWPWRATVAAGFRKFSLGPCAPFPLSSSMSQSLVVCTQVPMRDPFD